MSLDHPAPTEAQVVLVIPAYNEATRLPATLSAVKQLSDVALVVVADDGSTDDTAAIGRDRGAVVVSHERRQGKAAAMLTGAHAATSSGHSTAPLLFLDADLGASAAHAGPLIAPVLAGDADLTIGVLPPGEPAGGHGFVVRLAAGGIRRATGWTPTQPLSGQRCITRPLFDQVQPLADGFGVETGMTIDALRRGARVIECPVPFTHRVTGAGWRDQRHRARQYREVRRALASRR